VGGWGCYRLVSELLVETLDKLVSELLVETPARYGLGLLVRVLGSVSNSNHEVENLRRNGVEKSTQEIERQRPILRGSKDRDHPSLNLGVIATVGSREIWDRQIGGQVNKGRLMKRKQGLRSQSSDPIRE
jgi:hypothetical protein